MPTPWRRQLYRRIAGLDLAGTVVDLGGSRKSGYHGLIKGKHEITVVNIDSAYGFDQNFDLEKPFPVPDASYDAALAMNVLEHIYGYAQFLRESRRILRPGGRLIVGVPFLMHFHPSPRDYWRYTEETLARIFAEAGFADVDISPVGKGPFTASVQLLSGVIGVAIVRVPLEWLALGLDGCLALALGKGRLAKRYPLGYFIVARK